MFEWDMEPVSIGSKPNVNVDIAVPKIYLLMAGMEKEDIRNLLKIVPPSEKQELLALREEAGALFKEMGISTRSATMLLLNIGEMHYSTMGCREEWAVYAHKKISSSTGSCAKYFFITVGIIILIYFLMK